MPIASDEHVSSFQGRLTSPFQAKVTFNSLATIVGKYANELEAVFADIVVAKSIAGGVGTQLDDIGEVVGQPRGNAPDDATYRLYLFARILVNHSSGTVDELSAIGKLITAASTAWVEENLPNEVIVHLLSTAVDVNTRTVVLSMMHDAKLDAIRVQVHSNTYPPALAFTFAGGPGLGFGAGHLSSSYEA
jgi:hypothetical protein